MNNNYLPNYLQQEIIFLLNDVARYMAKDENKDKKEKELAWRVDYMRTLLMKRITHRG